MVDIKEVAKLILLQVKHNQECGKEDIFTIDEITNLLERRFYGDEVKFSFSKEDFEKMENYMLPLYKLTNDIFEHEIEKGEKLPKEIEEASEHAESSLIMIKALFNARKNIN